MLLWVWDRVRVRESKPICWFSWALVAVWPFAFVLGKYKHCQCFQVKFVTYYVLFILFCMFFSYSNWPWIYVFISFFRHNLSIRYGTCFATIFLEFYINQKCHSFYCFFIHIDLYKLLREIISFS